MTNYLIGERCSGKTTRLILRSARDQLYILTSTKYRAHAIFDAARDMGLVIPFPVTLDEYLRGTKFQGSSIRRDGLLIDDVDDVVRTLFAGIPIHEVTLTDYGNVERLESRIKPLDHELDSYRFHDLTKDPTDLPAKYGEDWVLVKIDICGMDAKPLIAEYRDGKWYSDDKDDVCLDDFCKVLGWFRIYDPCREEE